MAFLAQAAAAASGIATLMDSLATERSPTVIYDLRFPRGMKMRLVKFWMHKNLFKTFNFDKYNDTEAHELGGTQLRVCGSGYAIFYSDEYDTGIILAFSNPDVGTNKIGGKLCRGMPTIQEADRVWDTMDDHYGAEVCVSQLGQSRLYVKNNRGDPATGYYALR